MNYCWGFGDSRAPIFLSKDAGNTSLAGLNERISLLVSSLTSPDLLLNVFNAFIYKSLLDQVLRLSVNADL